MENNNQLIRLSQAAKQLNIGYATLVITLESLGHKIANNPNAKLNMDQFQILKKAIEQPNFVSELHLKTKIDKIISNETTIQNYSEMYDESLLSNFIGFQNFRRFQNFRPIKHSGITILVGRNNSGKSTLVKALVLLNDFFKSDDFTTFSFGQNSLEDTNIVTYGRAKNKKGTEEDNFIQFFQKSGQFSYTLKINGPDDKIKAKVLEFIITDIENGFEFKIAPPFVTINKNEGNLVVTNEKDDLLDDLLENEVSLKKQLENIEDKSSLDYINTNQQLTTLKTKIRDLKKSLRQVTSEFSGFSVEAEFNSIILKDMFEDVILDITSDYEKAYRDIQKGKAAPKEFEDLKAFKDNKFKLEKTLEMFFKSIQNKAIVYLGASLNKQSALFAIRDKSNPLAQAIHEYKQLGIDLDKGSSVQRFVKKWMSYEEGFEIGNDFEITMHAGEAYEVNITDRGVKTHLADKGMGSIQAMLLILRLASIIYKKGKDKLEYTIVIEEPELNLHPALQSKLSELFHEVYTDHNINFIIETHSEYLVRKTQLIVKKFEYEIAPNENPFSVLYFNNDDTQWIMQYREDGKFKNTFGKGFYDESNNLTFELI
jgi:predicted ATPase